MFCCLPPIFTLLIALWSDHYWSDIVSASSWCDRFFSLLALYLLMLRMSMSLIVYSVSRENFVMREVQLPIVIVFVFILILMSHLCTWFYRALNQGFRKYSITVDSRLRIYTYSIVSWNVLKFGITENQTHNQIFLLNLTPN